MFDFEAQLKAIVSFPTTERRNYSIDFGKGTKNMNYLMGDLIKGKKKERKKERKKEGKKKNKSSLLGGKKQKKSRKKE